MLHTDAFNKSNKRKMTKADYIKNTRLPGVAPEVLDVRSGIGWSDTPELILDASSASTTTRFSRLSSSSKILWMLTDSVDCCLKGRQPGACLHLRLHLEASMLADPLYLERVIG